MQLSTLPLFVIFSALFASTVNAVWCPYVIPQGTADPYCVRACAGGSIHLNCAGSWCRSTEQCVCNCRYGSKLKA
ncbi:hypothetical protein V8F20_004963 [Naviculisporaceae sp. PSN 640]